MSIWNDADIEMAEITAHAYEAEAETCNKCGDTDQSITWGIFEATETRPRCQVYECICSHRTVWVGARRVS